MTKIANRLNGIETSPTIALNTRVKTLLGDGIDVINLSVGEPDFPTPELIKSAGIQAIQENKTTYTAPDGTPELKTAIQKKLARENNLNYQPSQIIACAGAKLAIYFLAQAILNAGDEVIIPAPYWVSYPPIVSLANATPIIINTTIEQRYKISAEQLEKAITPKTKLFFLNNPNNPSGQLYSETELHALADVLQQHPHVLIMTDDIYEHAVWENAPIKNIIQLCPELYDRTVIINGVSKAYAMTGWRIGYAAGPTEIISKMKVLASQSTSNPCSIAQAAATAALTHSPNELLDMTTIFKERHDCWIDALQKIKGFNTIPSDGTFYSFPEISEIIARLDGINTDTELCEYILNKAHVAVAPGSAFGTPNCIRISFAVSKERLKEAVDRIAAILTS